MSTTVDFMGGLPMEIWGNIINCGKLMGKDVRMMSHTCSYMKKRYKTLMSLMKTVNMTPSNSINLYKRKYVIDEMERTYEKIITTVQRSLICKNVVFQMDCTMFKDNDVKIPHGVSHIMMYKSNITHKSINILNTLLLTHVIVTQDLFTIPLWFKRFKYVGVLCGRNIINITTLLNKLNLSYPCVDDFVDEVGSDIVLKESILSKKELNTVLMEWGNFDVLWTMDRINKTLDINYRLFTIDGFGETK